MRKRRTVYFNDARHYYLFVYEPPMRMEDAWSAVDEVAGTAVDTFVYGVARDDGLFYPSKVGMRFGEDIQPFDTVPYWRLWHNMQSLLDRGLDPLTVLIDRAHAKGMDFIASLRLGGYGRMPEDWMVSKGGRGFVHAEVRDHQFAVLQELATQYATEGVELDLAAPPAGSSFCLKSEDAPEYTPVMTDFVRRVADMVRKRPGKAGLVGARVYPTEELNRKSGLDVRAWLSEGLVDYVVPMFYGYFVLDANMPIEWLIKAAHEHDVSAYAMLQPYSSDESRREGVMHATPAMMRAAAANFWDLGVDGLYTWFFAWPLGDSERRTLTELGDPDLIRNQDKHYFLRWRSTYDEDYPALLPMEIESADRKRRYQIPFRLADDTADDHLHSLTLRIGVGNTVTHDKYEVLLNGTPLARESCSRNYMSNHVPYFGQWLEFRLQTIRPRKGENLLEISLLERPDDFEASVTIEALEIVVQYGMYPVE